MYLLNGQEKTVSKYLLSFCFVLQTISLVVLTLLYATFPHPLFLYFSLLALGLGSLAFSKLASAVFSLFALIPFAYTISLFPVWYTSHALPSSVAFLFMLIAAKLLDLPVLGLGVVFLK